MEYHTQQYAIKCFKEEAQSILNLIPLLTSDFDKAVELIYNCKGRFIVTGVGKSGHIGRKIAATLASTGTPSFFVNPLDAFHGDLGMFTPNDVVMAISYSGNTEELLRFIPFLKERNIPIIGVSGNPNSLLSQNSSCHLNVHVSKEACPLNLAPTSSTTATLAMGDAIACALIEIRQFKPEDFALFHPGGSLGKRLLTKVKNAMITTNLPIVTLETMISDLIIEISKTKLGIAVALDDNKRILGVVTDGDVRRAMVSEKNNFFNLKVEDIMSKSPKIINENQKLTEAETLMRKYNIHSLIVVNDNNDFVGVIDTFNCL